MSKSDRQAWVAFACAYLTSSKIDAMSPAWKLETYEDAAKCADEMLSRLVFRDIKDTVEEWKGKHNEQA